MNQGQRFGTWHGLNFFQSLEISPVFHKHDVKARSDIKVTTKILKNMLFIAAGLWRAFLFKWRSRSGGWHLNQAVSTNLNGFQVFSRSFYKTKGQRWIFKNSSTYGRKIVQESWGLVIEKGKKKNQNRDSENQADESKWSTDWTRCRKGELVCSPLRLHTAKQPLSLVNTSVPRNANSNSTSIKFYFPTSNSVCVLQSNLYFFTVPSLRGRITKDLSFFFSLCSSSCSHIQKGHKAMGDRLLWKWGTSKLGCRG